MMRRAIFVAISTLACAGSIVFFAHGDAPKDQYAIFQPQTTLIRDQKTLLEWERYPEKNLQDGAAISPTMKHAEATARCASYGMRLPTVKELLTIVDEDPHKVYADGSEGLVYVDRNAFPTTARGGYFTSSPSGGQVFVVDFSTGLVTTANPTDDRYARCVRGVTDAGGN